jgi:hypothetical protein
MAEQYFSGHLIGFDNFLDEMPSTKALYAVLTKLIADDAVLATDGSAD